jgi:RNA polymerase sigma-70 factor (ECF subfamily)
MSAAAGDDDLQALRERRPGALEALVRAHSGALLGAALGLGLADTDAEELVQETFAAFLKGLERFEGRSRLRTYLFGILYNKASELRRRRGREQPLEGDDPAHESRFDARGHWARPPQGPEEAALSKEVSEIIARCAEGLTTAQRAAFFMKEVQGADPREICNVLDVSGTHLRVILFRARVKLRECLEKNWLERSGART